MFSATCTRCHTPFEAKTARAKYCSASCRALDSKDRKTHPQPSTGNVFTLPGKAAAKTIRAAVLEQLGDQQDGVPGRQALALADRLDNGVSDGAWAAMSKRLGELLDEAARAGVRAKIDGGQTDPVEFLKRRGDDRARGVLGVAG